MVGEDGHLRHEGEDDYYDEDEDDEEYDYDDEEDEMVGLLASNITPTSTIIRKRKQQESQGRWKQQMKTGAYVLALFSLIAIIVDMGAHYIHNKSNKTLSTSEQSSLVDPTSSNTQKSYSRSYPKLERTTEQPTATEAAVASTPSPTIVETSPPTTKQSLFVRQYEYQRRGKESFTEFVNDRTDVDPWPDHLCHPPPSSSSREGGDNKNGDDDIFRSYPNRDVPRTEFPMTSWQRNRTYLQEEFLPAGIRLVSQTRQWIYEEYGYTNNEWKNRSSNDPTNLFYIALLHNITTNEGDNFVLSENKKANRNGGWMTTKSYKGLQRRLLHSIITEDTFIIAMGGHSAAAGHGNHFQQSYTLIVQRIMEPILARLGVRHEARNFGQGGLGTIQNGLAVNSLYGPDLDMLLWDSGMTEKQVPRNIDVMARQALVGPHKIPMLLNFPVKDILRPLVMDGGMEDMDMGGLGSGMDGIPVAETFADLDNIAYAARYLRCVNDIKKDSCDPQKYSGICWIPRQDYFPTTKQEEFPSGRSSWHPGYRTHQLTGRIWTMMILQALEQTLFDWKEYVDSNNNNTTNDGDGGDDDEDVLPIPPDEEWHMTNYYDSIRQKARSLDASVGDCHKLSHERENIPSDILCHYPVKARSEFTPRAFPDQTSLRSLMPPDMRRLVNPPGRNVYQPPDVYIPLLDPPNDAVDVLSMVERGPPYCPISTPSYLHLYYDDENTGPGNRTNKDLDPGKGFSLDTREGFCDGTLNSFCSRGIDQTCLLRGHNDGRGGIYFDSFSGWLKFEIPQVELGMIIIKMEMFHASNKVPATQGWTSINNVEPSTPSETEEELDNQRRRELSLDWEEAWRPASDDMPLEEEEAWWPNIVLPGQDNATFPEGEGTERRRLNPPIYCQDFQFQYSINGEITTLSLDEFLDQRQDIGKNVEVLTLSEGDISKNPTAPTTVEVALRMLGCKRNKVFKLTHIYWA